jgi:hypothetical protein
LAKKPTAANSPKTNTNVAAILNLMVIFMDEPRLNKMAQAFAVEQIYAPRWARQKR